MWPFLWARCISLVDQDFNSCAWHVHAGPYYVLGHWNHATMVFGRKLGSDMHGHAVSPVHTWHGCHYVLCTSTSLLISLMNEKDEHVLTVSAQGFAARFKFPIAVSPVHTWHGCHYVIRTSTSRLLSLMNENDEYVMTGSDQGFASRFKFPSRNVEFSIWNQFAKYTRSLEVHRVLDACVLSYSQVTVRVLTLRGPDVGTPDHAHMHAWA
eukprot:jgi/Botrbrau1/4305/Bobra.0390s0044.1